MSAIEFRSCPLCGGDFSHLYRLSHVDVVRCMDDSCGLVFAKSQPSDSELIDYYNEHLYPKGDPTTVTAPKPNSDIYKFQQHFLFLNKSIGLVGKRVLDYGCGIGNFLEVARKSGVAEAVGVEFNDRAREIASSKGFLVERDLDQIESNSFDVVYMNDVIEHLRDPVAVLRDVGRVLAPNGHVFVVTINVKGLKPRLLKEAWDDITEPTHFFYYDRKSLCRTLKQAGYRLVQEKKFAVKFSHHNSARKIAQYALVKMGLDSGLKVVAGKFKG